MAITEVKALDFEQSLTPLAKELTTLEKQAAKEPSPAAEENVEEPGSPCWNAWRRSTRS